MKSVFVLNPRDLQSRYPFAKLVQPMLGMVQGVTRLFGEPTAPDFEIATAMLDNLTVIFPHVTPSSGLDASSELIGGAGADRDPELAWVRAVAEAAERYAAMAFDEDDFRVATAEDLGSDALDLDGLPRCSETEYAHPLSKFSPPDKCASIRWVKGVSLLTDKTVYVPAVMAHLYMHPWTSERFWPMISTGTAAHTDPIKALCSAICESIERDAIALTWLCRLPLPRIEFNRDSGPVLSPNLRLLGKSRVEQIFFDATTDVGIPTVYSLQLLEGSTRLSQYVSCATDFTMEGACAKAIREAAPARAVFQMDRSIPRAIDDFEALFDGATYMARRENRHQFDFLLQSARRIPVDHHKGLPPDDSQAQLRFLTERLRALDMDAFAIDLTCDELRSMGMWVVKVVIPKLLPMSVVHRSRFLGHPRLYDYPPKAGYGEMTEAMVNPAPQPFA